MPAGVVRKEFFMERSRVLGLVMGVSLTAKLMAVVLALGLVLTGCGGRSALVGNLKWAYIGGFYA
jgi:hypothetical protein